MDNNKLSYEERLEQEMDLENLSLEIFNDAMNELTHDDLPSALEQIYFYQTIINLLQHKIWDCEENNLDEKLSILEELDDNLRSDFSDFKEKFLEKYPTAAARIE